MTLRVVDSEIVHMDKLTFMWVQLTHFDFDPSRDDRSVLTALVASRGYVHDYASPFDASEPISEPAVHGRWYRDRINADLFEPWAATDAEALVTDWVNDQEWDDLDCRQLPDVHARLRPVFDLLRAGPLYKLRNPGTEAEHEYGFVTGNGGFHEFVVINRASERLHVVVASDD